MNGAGKTSMESTKGLRLLVFCCGFLATFAATLPSEEVSALKDVYYSTQGAFWRNTTGWWPAGDDPCTWFGVSCNSGKSHVMCATFPREIKSSNP